MTYADRKQSEQVLMELRNSVIHHGTIGESDYRDLYFACFGKILDPSVTITTPTEDKRSANNEQNLSALLFSFDETLSEEHRVLSGSYYTPLPLVKSLWLMTLVQYFADEEAENRDSLYGFFQMKDHDPALYGRIRPKLSTLVIADIAAGSGQMLAGFRELVGELDIHYAGHRIPLNLSRFYLADQSIAALEIMLLVALLWRKEGLIESLPQFICGDSLSEKGPLDSILHARSVDVLIGNPPYLGEKNNREIFERIRETPWGREHYEGKMDIFYFFIYKGLSLIKPGGVLAFITTRYFVTADGAKALRLHLKNNASFLAFHHLTHKAFKSAPGQDNCLFALTCSSDLPVEIGRLEKDQRFHVCHRAMGHRRLFTRDGNILIADSPEIYGMVPLYWKEGARVLGDDFQVSQGLVSGYDRQSFPEGEKPVFVFEDQECSEESIYLKPFYKSSDIQPCCIQRTALRRILYITHQDSLDEASWEYSHLLPYKDKLVRRREFRDGNRPWYALHWYRQDSIFNAEKLVVPQRCSRPRFAYHEGPFYASADVYFIKAPQGREKALISLMVYLNSPVAEYYFYHFGKRKGENLELYATPLAQIPLPVNPAWIDRLYSLGLARMSMVEATPEFQKQLDDAVYAVMEWEESAIRTVRHFAEKRRSKP